MGSFGARICNLFRCVKICKSVPGVVDELHPQEVCLAFRSPKIIVGVLLSKQEANIEKSFRLLGGRYAAIIVKADCWDRLIWIPVNSMDGLVGVGTVLCEMERFIRIETPPAAFCVIRSCL